MMRLFYGGLVISVVLFTLRTTSQAEMYWNLGLSENETVVTIPQSEDYKIDRLAQSRESSRMYDNREVAEMAPQPVSRKSRVRVPKNCPFAKDGK